jgi:hypothetical protein
MLIKLLFIHLCNVNYTLLFYYGFNIQLSYLNCCCFPILFAFLFICLNVPLRYPQKSYITLHIIVSFLSLIYSV